MTLCGPLAQGLGDEPGASPMKMQYELTRGSDSSASARFCAGQGSAVRARGERVAEFTCGEMLYCSSMASESRKTK